MRLIDADILDNELWKLYLNGDDAESFRTIDEDTIIGKGQVSDLIAEQPTVQAVPIDALDKIRAEIEQTADEEHKYDEKWSLGLRYAVKIIDKYKAESEDKE